MSPIQSAKLYLEDPYRTEFKATVLSCGPAEADYAVVLDQTYFYPESGGQRCDRGTIAGVDVIDVQEDRDDRVIHILAAEVAPGPAACRIDWDRRFDHMQHHSGQHVLSRAFIDVARLETVSFHMGDDACTIDLSGGAVTDAIVRAVEARANQVIFENRPVHVRNVAPGDLASEELRRKLPEGVTEVRLIDIEAFDVCGCCGTHVRQTGELGLIKVLRSEKAKGAERVSFKVGRRALADFQDKHDIVRALANKFTTAASEILEKIDKLQDEGQQQRKDNKQLAQRLAEFEAKALLESARQQDGWRVVMHVCADASDDYVRTLGGLLKTASGTVSMIATTGGTVVCNASPDTGVDFQTSVVALAKSLGGSGGGKGGFASIRLAAGTDVGGFLEAAYEAISSR